MPAAPGSESNAVVVASFYRLVRLADYRSLREPLLAFCRQQELRGSILLAEEGINGTIAGAREAVAALMEHLGNDPRLEGLRPRQVGASFVPFRRMRVRLKKEIITLRAPEADPARYPGRRVDPRDWNELILDPSVTLIDTRNAFEVEAGSFEGAVNPMTRSFGQFPEWAAANLDPRVHKKVAMFCTGGIRCEKAAALLLHRGFAEVYQLSGGILAYLDQTPRETSLWRGECVVFDERGSES